MPEAETDSDATPSRVPWPPLLIAGLVVVAVTLGRWWPLGWPGLDDTIARVIGIGIGVAGVAWGELGLAACHLPERDAETARGGVLRRFPEAIEAEVPASLASTVQGVQALMRGEKADLSAAPLDLTRTPEFHARVYQIARAIPPGETLTYGEVAEKLGDKLLAREVAADLFVMATDVESVYADWGTPEQRALGRVPVEELRKQTFPAGSMGPKVEAACRFVEATGGRAAIGALTQIQQIVEGDAGTQVVPR